MKMSKRSKIVIYALLGLVALYFLAPFIYMLFSAFKTESEAIAYPPKLFPTEWHFENFINAWKSQPFGTYLWNSILVTVFTTLGQVLSCSLVAYGFARFEFKGKNLLFMILLSTMMIPWDVTMIPQYMEFNLFGWINTLKPLIVPAWFGSAYYVFLMRQFLMGIPKDFDEAAYLDGASHIQIFTKIILPITKPALAVVGMFAFLNSWNDFLNPLVYLNSEKKYTVALGLQLFTGSYRGEWNLMMAAACLVLAPVVVVFAIGQKYLIEGVTMSGVKG